MLGYHETGRVLDKIGSRPFSMSPGTTCRCPPARAACSIRSGRWASPGRSRSASACTSTRMRLACSRHPLWTTAPSNSRESRSGNAFAAEKRGPRLRIVIEGHFAADVRLSPCRRQVASQKSSRAPSQAWLWLPHYTNWPGWRRGSCNPRAWTGTASGPERKRASAHDCRVFLLQENAADHHLQQVELR